MSTKMKVIITGDSGLLGANLAFLWREKFDVIGVSRHGTGISGTRHVSADLTDAAAAASIVEECRPDAVIHTAALVPVEDCEKEPEKAELYNVRMTENVVSAAKRVSSHMIYISTDAFYQGSGKEPCNESHPVTLGSVYARTKHEGEIPVLDYEKGLVLRTNIYGFNLLDKASFGEWILRDLKAGKTLTMFTDVLFSPILVNDLADVIEKALDTELFGLYNAGGSGVISKHDFALKLKKHFAIDSGEIIPTSVKDFKFNAWRSTNMSMDNGRIKAALGIDIPDAGESIKHFKKLYDISYKEKLKENEI